MKNSDPSFVNSTSQEALKPSPTKKPDSFTDSLRLTPSEIESLRRHKQKALAQNRGKSKHLFEK